MEAAQNTFFNETARQPTGSGAPAGQIRADRWEAAEPGYHTGDLLARAATGQLGNQSALSASAPDDAALALSLPVPEWQPGQRLSVTATLTPAAVADASLLQTDAASGQSLSFDLRAKLQTNTPTPTPTPGPAPAGLHAVPGPGGLALGALSLLLGACYGRFGGLGRSQRRKQDSRQAGSAGSARRLLAVLPTLVCAAVLLTGWLAPVQPAHALFDNGGFETGDTSGWQSSHGLNYALQGSQPFSASSIVIYTGGQRLGGVLGATFDPRAPHLDLPRAGHYTAKINDEQGG